MKPAQVLGAVALATALFSHATDAATPESERGAFRIARGFDIRVFADEDNGVVKPIQSRFDARGRLWVVGSTVYPQIQPGKVPDDKVVVIEDTDGDGRADKTTVFATGLFIPTGIELTEDGCLVGNSTELLRLRDTDGDGKADVREVLLRGFGTGDNHQNLNSFQWSPGGELWFSQGLHANSRVETPWGVVRLEHAGIWRLRPRRMQLDGFFGNELPPHNPWGFVFDDWGAMTVLAGNGHGIYDPLPIAFRGHAVRPLDQVWRDSRGRKLCGGDICGNAHFPDRWQGVMFAGGFMNNAVYTLTMSRDGSTFRLDDVWFGADEVGPPPGAEAVPSPGTAAKQVNDATAPAPGIGGRQPFLASTQTQFRPVDVKFGPDGALYLTDWSNPIIGHYQTSFRHPDRDKTHGRIWRITAIGREAVKQPAALVANPPSIPALLELLKSSDRFTRLQARRQLSAAETPTVVAALKQWVATLSPADPGFEHHLFEALGIAEDHESVDAALLDRVASAKDARARAWAAQTIGRWADRLPDPLARLQSRLRDSDSRVRLAAVVSCGTILRPESLTAALQALDESTDGTVAASDRFLDYALRQAVFVLKPYWLPTFRENPLAVAGSPGRLQYLVAADASPDTVGTVRSLADKQDLPKATLEAFLNVLAEAGTAEDYATLLGDRVYTLSGRVDAPRQTRVLHRLEAASRARGLRPAGNFTPDLTRICRSRFAELQTIGLRLAALWKIPALDVPALTAIAEASDAADEQRVAATTLLATVHAAAAEPILANLARPGAKPGVQSAATVALLALNVTNAAKTAASVLAADDSGRSAPSIVAAFVARTGGSAILASALGTTPPSRDAARLGLRWMQAAGRNDPALTQTLSRAAKLDAEPLKATPAFVAALATETLTQGNAARGREIFRRPDLNCMACHSVAGEGGNIGPDLNAIGSGQPLDFIIGAVLEPNKEVKENYEAVEVTTKDGETYIGYRVKTGNDAEFTLRDTARNEIVRLRRDTISQTMQKGSVMPPGLVDHLTRAELRDLFRYLSELGKAKL